MQISKICEWFIEPIGSHTNEWLSKHLAEHQAIDNAHVINVNDGAGVPHDVIAVPSYSTVRTMLQSARDLNFKFNIFRRLHGNNRISRWQPFRRRAHAKAIQSGTL